ncbi:beta-L-arabinofuranosidase domain-containing protein [Prolixibacter sp. SD074]|uniref:beta-L-arabinofuranosidase domain-containing protein n=1 Tax=Prolixibacter sp. SD074 TaxID=2652391 RepID=UPI001298F924|nr:beta-L-arabinofuranosidase domain-containing protein [Prolixibacter sp. SD074]
MKSILITQKLKQYCLFVFFPIIFFYPAQSQTAHLPNHWKFKLGDNIEWASPAFDDSGWDNMQTGASWSTKELKDNVYAWYRVKIVIPSSMKSAVENGKEMKLCLGKIDDVDQTFFNGKLIGQTGSLPPDYKTKWDVEREYIISGNEIQWDKENLIAVRVFSLDNGGIGMYQGPYSIGPVQWTDYISVRHSISETGNNGFITKIQFTNNSNNAFVGTVNYSIKDKLGKEVYSEKKQVEMKPEKGAETDITFQDYKPGNADIFKVSFGIAESGSSDTINNEQVYLANKNIEIKVAAEPKVVIEDKIKDVYTSIPFQNQILQGYLGERSSQNLEERLLKVDENGIMSGYLQRPGSHPWIGEHVGKYLEAACNVWKNTHDPRLKKQMDRMMYELVNAQLKDGYLGTYSPEDYWTSWDVWSHKYNLYGLLAYYTTTGYQPALDACKRMGDLLCTTFGNKSGQRDIILSGEHVGMAATSVLDPMVELYKYTGQKKYLDFCYYILEAWEQKNGPKIISSLLETGQVNKVANGKAYEMLSNLLGLANLYRVTGDPKLLKPVLIAWQDIVSNRLYITGTTSSFEHFQGDNVLPAADTDHIGEGCVTVTWIQLNQRLLAITGDLKYMEQIEKSIYNQLFGAENPESGCVSYYTPLMGKKPYSCGISCCTSSVPRGIALIPYSTIGNVNNIPTLMLFGPAIYKENITTADKKDINLSVKIESSFPETGSETITLNPSQTCLFTFALRVPSWSSSFIAEVNGKEYPGTANQYLEIKRVWKSGDKIKVSFKIPGQVLNGGKSYPGQIAFQRGPQVLAFDSSLNPDLPKEFSLGAKEKLLAEEPEAANCTGLLPKVWIGKQVYIVRFPDSKKEETNEKLLLVPFADAGQTGGDVKVWLPLNENK